VAVRVSVPRDVSILEDPTNSHNRWWPDLEPVATIGPGDEIVVECRDGMDGQVDPGSDSTSLAGLNLDANHPLTGPIEIRGARPGDVLEVETLAIDCDSFGATYVIPGFGLLGDLFDEAELFRWDIEGGVARSPDLPGVTIRGEPYLGTVGVAPSWKLLERASEREAALLERGGSVLPPQPAAAVPATEPFASRALRTIPPRENGGNLDIRQAGIGSRLLLPVHVDGALLSVGDIHFAQGDGESCGTAIEVAGVARLRVAVRRAAELSWQPRFPVVLFDTQADPAGRRRCIATTGIPLSDSGELGNLDITLAARRALLELVDHLAATRGYSRAQAYALASVAADLRISEAVNVPSAMVSAILPLDVFDDEP
jgi:formamidase